MEKKPTITQKNSPQAHEEILARVCDTALTKLWGPESTWVENWKPRFVTSALILVTQTLPTDDKEKGLVCVTYLLEILQPPDMAFQRHAVAAKLTKKKLTSEAKNEN